MQAMPQWSVSSGLLLALTCPTPKSLALWVPNCNNHQFHHLSVKVDELIYIRSWSPFKNFRLPSGIYHGNFNFNESDIDTA